MPDSGDNRKPIKPHNPGVPPPEQEHLPCPRCDSTNTKFCYYNNYNFSQPRHFCKSCRRYWTHGGTLRDIPVGGGSRKNAKRSRTCIPSSVAAGNANSSSSSSMMSHALSASSVQLVPLVSNHGSAVQYGGGEMMKSNGNNVCGSFTSLLNANGQAGFWSLGGFGIGLGNGFEEVGYAPTRVAWPFLGLNDGGAGGGGNGGPVNTWQFENGEGGFVGADCLPWPELAISTPGNGLK